MAEIGVVRFQKIFVYTIFNQNFPRIAVKKPFEKIDFFIRKNRFSFELIDLNFEEKFEELAMSRAANKWLQIKLSMSFDK